MEALDAQAYKKRWQAVAEIKRKELRSATPADNWRKLNAIKQRALRLGITQENDDGEMAIFLLWARLKSEYVSN
ncbi:MAG: hypothetical protein GY796_19545 [Chloroflexi bacterium]|nr:hypothetical protein [Chloroflexota bacterium]